ncbi:MAG: DUF1513 domain-containing protein [Bdellovibrionaceae bacterium]|nr:DUF1513 domain-containing protein [Pseudobdellovibrionaceae bacterium]
MKRREFLGVSLTALTAVQLPIWAWGAEPAENRWILVSRSSKDLTATLLQAGEPVKSVLKVLDRNFKQIIKVDLNFSAHSWVQDEASPNLVYGFSKWGNEAGVVDLKTKKFVGYLERPEGMRFFGHGLQLPDGRMLVSMRNDKKKQGCLVYFKGTKPTGEVISTGDGFTHELRFLPGSTDKIVAATGGSGRGLQWIDLKTGKVTREMRSAFMYASHFRFVNNSDQRIVVLGTADKPSVQVIDGEKEFFIRWEGKYTPAPGAHGPESLNAAQDPSDPNIYWVAISATDLVFKLDIEKKKVVDVRHQEKIARHAFRYGKDLYISRYENGVSTLQRLGFFWRDTRPPKDFGNSSHVDLIQPVV